MLAARIPLSVLAVSLVLAACSTQTTMVTDSPGALPGGATAAATQPAAASPAAAPTPAAPAPPPVAPTPPPAGRAARAPATPPAPPADDQPMTITRAREQCWMLAETQRARDVDSRVKFVEKCVQDKMK
jgi:hypothetical protein